MGKGKKRGLKGLVLLSIVVILIVCCFTLAACGKTTNEKNSGTNIEQSEGQGNNSGNQSEIEQGGQTGGQETGGQETGGQETGGETGGEVTPDPEKTPAEYKAECEEKITNALEQKIDEWWGEDGTKVSSFKINAVDGTIYAKATLPGAKGDSFFTVNSNLSNVNTLTYKQINEKCNDLSLTVKRQDAILSAIVSEEKYNDLCNYVLADVGLEGGTVLNASKFGSAADGMRGTTLTVLYNNKIATINANCYSATTDNVECIDNMLEPEANNNIRITSYEDYKDFDYLNNEASMSAVSYNLNLGGKTIATKTANGTFNMNLSVQ